MRTKVAIKSEKIISSMLLSKYSDNVYFILTILFPLVTIQRFP